MREKGMRAIGIDSHLVVGKESLTRDNNHSGGHTEWPHRVTQNAPAFRSDHSHGILCTMAEVGEHGSLKDNQKLGPAARNLQQSDRASQHGPWKDSRL
jgi:hypothetical protein